MLETLRKQGASILIYAVFGILIAMFVINFGAQSVGTSEGCTKSAGETIATVDGHDVGAPAWRWINNLLKRYPKEIRAQYALDWLVQRQILMTEADRRGLQVSDDLIDDNIKAGRIYHQGHAEDARGAYFQKHGTDKAPEYFFDYEAFKRLVGDLGFPSVAGFKEQQRKEILAAMALEMIAGSARASKDEARARYVYENNKVSFDLVTFSPVQYAAAMSPSDADLDKWLAAHDADAKAQYDKDKKSYTGTKPTVRLRQIYVAKAEPAKDAPPAAGSGSGSGSAAPAPAAPAKDTGLDKLTAARADIVAKKKTFADVAKTLDSDPAQRNRAGDLGWRPIEDLALGDDKLVAAIKTMKPGDLSEVITTDAGYYLLTVEDKREGDLSYDQVKREIASTLARKAWADEAAKRAALAALEQATAQKKNLSDMFPHGMSPEEKRRIQQELQQRLQMKMQEQGRSGAITVESKDVPAAWTAEADVVPAAGSGSAAPAPAAAPEIKASTDALPTMTEVKVEVIRYSEVRRDARQLGEHPPQDLIAALFDQLADGQLAPRVYKIGDDYAVAQLIKKDAAKPEDFEKIAQSKVADLSAERGERFAARWLHDRCQELSKASRIKYSPKLFETVDDSGKTVQGGYQPCFTLRLPEDEEAEIPAAP